MTREEMENIKKENAIKELKNLQINIGSSPDDLDNSPLYYALDWAIRALEKQSSEEDCINRKAAINVVHKYFMDYLKLNDDICLDGLRSLPSVIPSRPKGHWIEHPHECGDNWQYPKYECSKCHIWVEYDDDFCPGCGADMTEGEEE